MFQFDTWLSVLLVLAIAALSLMLWRWWRRKRSMVKLERDPSGMWRYHRDTMYQKKLAYRHQLGGDPREENVETVAVISFTGDIRARQHKSLGALVDEVVVNAEDLDEVVVVLNSPGGMVPPYGHAYSQMERLRALGIRLTVCVDVVAASGGYLMTLPAHKIVAAPLAIVGSIGVMAFVPNFREMLLSHKITPRTFTAGKFKRTVTLTDEATDEEVARFQEQLEEIHRQFAAAVKKYRPDVDTDKVATGEHWTAEESLEKELGLVDELGTSEQYLLERNRYADLVFISQRRNLFDDGFGRMISRLSDEVEERVYSRLAAGQYGLPY
ncbi:MAG: protease SohB [Bdellovibrionales bacterium]|nr:protease SohB [Bdellovibrionales bacterium]